MANPEPQVYKANALVTASYRLSVMEQRIILAAISQVRRDDGKVSDQIFYTIRAMDIAEMAGTNPKQAYRDLREAAIRLMRREVWVTHTPEGERRSETLHTRFIQSGKYNAKEGLVRIKFSNDILPYVSNLEKRFTRYPLSDVGHMSSEYAMRLYELLIEVAYKEHERTVEIDWLRHLWQLGDKYPAIKDFKKWVLKPAVKQINEHSPLHVEWSQSKTGRRVTHLHFKFQVRSLPKKRQEVNGQQQATKTGADRDPNGRTYGIKNIEVLAAQREGENFEDAAYRLMFERKQEALF